ncbi:MAG: GTPase ObgE [Chloroflexota bacterium]|nr:GTPase ObgE [Chloroflexota bacterium]
MYDRAKIDIKAGNGGNGSASLRTEKFVPKGGPDGGDGGRGGSVYIQADRNLNTLLSYRYKRHFKAQTGTAGSKQKRHGKAGEDLVLTVPPGTVVYDDATGEVIADLTKPGDRVMVARGGRGGLGNTHFSTSTYQTPRFAERGEPGEERTLRLELKLLADVALVGFPNAGKSTLISAISAATPKIASYPFTTLEPVLGVVQVPGTDQSFVVADIPGLIEGAHQGVGLGDEFLRHIERTRVLVYVLDGSGQEGRPPINDLQVLRRELSLYQPQLAERPSIIAFNKMDMTEAQENWEEFRNDPAVQDADALPVSGTARIGLDQLVLRIAQELESAPPHARFAPQVETVLRPQEVDSDRYQISREDDHTWAVSGPTIERIAVMTDMENEEAVRRLERELNRMGISRRLQEAGIENGDTLRIGSVEIDWGETEV